MHVRRAIREDAVTALTGLTTTGSRVHNTRIFSISESGLPCLAIYTGDEAVGYASLGGMLERELELRVRGYARAVSGVEAVLDEIAEEVEVALTDLTDTKELVLRSIETEFDGDGDMPIAMITLTFATRYYTETGDPTVAL